MMRLGLDAMGGDFFPSAPVAGALLALPQLEGARICLVGPTQAVHDEIVRQGGNPHDFDLLQADEVVGMHDSAAVALKSKPKSSLMLGVQAHKAGQLDAFISAGNTGALMACSYYVLGTVPGVQRPSVGALYPYEDRFSLILDVGANVDVKPEQLVQFGIMGATYMRVVFGVAQPRVALMNIGEEDSKGPQNVQEAYKLMKKHPSLQFVGNAEGRDMLRGLADVYVVDGYAGNILLKFAESFYEVLKAKAPDDRQIEAFNYERVGGLPFLGVNGTILVGHGISSPIAFQNMLLRAHELVSGGLLRNLAEAFA